jgi:hypothetical protein
MSPPLHVTLRVIELANWDIRAFLIASSVSEFILADRVPPLGPFLVKVGTTTVRLTMAVEPEEGGEPKAFTELQFDHEMQADLALLSRKASPKFVRGESAGSIRPNAEIGMVNYSGETDTAALYSYEDTALLDAQEKEASFIASQVRALLPLASEAINQVREAVRLELFQNAIHWDFLVQSLISGQRYRGWEEAEIAPDLNDAAFLFAAFPGRGAPRLTQETNIRYTITDGLLPSHIGTIINARSGRSPEQLTGAVASIQARLATGWSVRDSALLSAVEHLYADSYRLAVFNAAAFFEAQILTFYQDRIASGRQGALLEHQLEDHRELNRARPTPAVAQFVLPKFIDPELVSSGALQRSIDAWEFRNTAAAHLKTPKSERRLSRDEAWAMVVSIYQVVDSLPGTEVQTPPHPESPAA